MKKLRHSILPITLESTDELKSDLLNAIDVQMTNSGWAKWVDEYGNWFDPFYKNSNQSGHINIFLFQCFWVFK